MPALNFRKQFAPKVESGEKRQTIRACREDGKNPRPGQTLYLYTGMRTKSCRKLREETCRESWPVYMDAQENGTVDVFIGGDLLSSADVEKLAVADGFDTSDEFIKFFSYCLPFKGYLILW